MAVACMFVASFVVLSLIFVVASGWRNETLVWLVLLIPLAGIAGGTWAAMGAWRISTHAIRLADGQCIHCGYDLRASAGRCSECGKAI